MPLTLRNLILTAVAATAIAPVPASHAQAPPPRVPTVLVPEADDQPGGPVHDFRMGTHEITNADYARFLNDALQNPSDPRGAFLYHDTDSGDVYIHHQSDGETGTGAPSALFTTRLYRASVGRISFDGEQDEHYIIEEGFEDHPVVGVSWYGAARFCNWLTLIHGMPESARIYTEGPDPDDWRPVTADPQTLLALPGYRLPLDGALAGINAHGEWLKAAARRPNDAEGNAVFGAIYGFGRQTLTARDANYLNNGDTPDNRTTPVGFFNGVNLMHIGGATADTANGYGLYDLCGNAAEWVHDAAVAVDDACAAGPEPCFVAATRGGHFFHVAAAPRLRNDTREPLPADSTFAFVGFRIAQSINPVPLEAIMEDDAMTITGPVGGPYDRDQFIVELHNHADYTHDDFSITLTAAWLDLDQNRDHVGGRGSSRAAISTATAKQSHDRKGAENNENADGEGTPSPPQLIPPQSSLVLPLMLNDHADDLLPGSHTGTLSIKDNISTVTIERTFSLTLSEPLIVGGPETTTWAGHYCDNFNDRTETFTITNNSARDMPWHITADQPWLSITADDKPQPTGTLPGLVDDTPADIELFIHPNETADSLPVGQHQAVVTITNTFTNQSTTRAFTLDIQGPVTIETEIKDQQSSIDHPDDPPTRDIFWGDLPDPLDPISFTVSRCDTCDPDCPLEYDITTAAEWLSLEPDDQLTGDIPPPGTPIEITASINAAADTLAPGQYDATINFTIREAGTIIDTPQRLVRLRVNDPIVIDRGPEVWNIGCDLDLDDLPTHTVTLTNRHRLAEIGVTATASVPWVELPGLTQVLPGAVRTVTIGLTESAIPLLGEHDVTLTFLDTLTGHAQHVSITASFAGEFCVTPLTSMSAYGPLGGTIEPSFAVYSVEWSPGLLASHQMGTAPPTSRERKASGWQTTAAIEWNASSDQPWLTLNGASSTGGFLDAGQRAHVIAAIDESLLPPLDPNVRRTVDTATIAFDNLTTEQSTTRIVTVTRVVPRFNLDEIVIPADVVQPGGPAYTFLMGRTHVTNQQFADFLNDALENLNDSKGHHLFFDTTTGDLYLNDTTLGAAGPDPEQRTIRLFSPAVAGQIELADGAYRVIDEPVDYAQHPVSGVSWFGAVKFANWLTLDQGMSPDMRCYTEDTAANPSGWRPATISAAAWSVRDLNDAERLALVADHRGFRLPMDDGYNNPTPTVDAPDDYNEWYKAGAWNPALNRNTLYGFGRDTITGADANFRCSGDPFEHPADCNLGTTTPAGFFDGSTYPCGTGFQPVDACGSDEDAFHTSNTDNTFGLMDMTGNLHHWLNGRYAPSAAIDRRTLRGGSWNDAASSDALRMDRRPLWAPPATISSQIGFRVARTTPIPSPDANGDGHLDADDMIYFTICHHGPDQSFPGGCAALDFNGDGRIDLRDTAAFFLHFGSP